MDELRDDGLKIMTKTCFYSRLCVYQLLYVVHDTSDYSTNSSSSMKARLSGKLGQNTLPPVGSGADVVTEHPIHGQFVMTEVADDGDSVSLWVLDDLDDWCGSL